MQAMSADQRWVRTSSHANTKQSSVLAEIEKDRDVEDSDESDNKCGEGVRTGQKPWLLR